MTGQGGVRSVVHVMCSEGYSGVERHVTRLARTQQDHGLAVSVLGGDREAMAADLRGTGIRWLPSPGVRDAVAAVRSLQQVDIVHTHMTASDLAGVLGTRVSGAPVVSTRHFTGTRGHSRQARWALAPLRGLVAEQIAISEAVAGSIEGPSTVIHAGVPVRARTATPRERLVVMAQRLQPEKNTALALRAAAYEQPGPRPADLPSTRVALYVGTLHEDRLDVALVLRTGDALAHSGARLVLIGPNALSRRSSELLQVHGNIDVLGPRAHEEVPGYLVHAEVLVVPHAVTPFTESLDPIKVYEYLASRRPIVSTPVAGFREQQDVEIVSPAEFPECVAEAVARPGADTAATPPTWRMRAEAFSLAVQDALKGRQPS